MGEVGPPTVHSSAVSRHGDRHLSGEGVSFRGSDALVLGLGGQVSRPSFSSSENVAAFFQYRSVDYRGVLAWLSGPFPSPPTCVTGTLGVSIMCSGVSSSAGSPRRGVQDAPEGGCGVGQSAWSRLLQPPFSGKEGNSVLAAGHQFVHPQWLCDTDQVPDGDSGIGFGVDTEGALDVLHGPQIRLLPDPQPFRLPSLSLVCSRGSGLPVLGPVLQSVHSSSGFHHGLFLGIGVGALAGCASPPVSRRLADCCRVFASSPSPSRSSAPVMLGPGIVIKWEKLDLQLSTRVVSRHGDRHLSGEGVSFRGSDALVSGLGGQVSRPSFSSSEDVAAAVGPHGITRVFSSQGSLSHASSSVAVERPLISHVGRSVFPGSSTARVCKGGSLVAAGGDVGCWRSSIGSSIISDSAHGCLFVRLGCLSLRSDGVWSLVSGGEPPAH